MWTPKYHTHMCLLNSSFQKLQWLIKCHYNGSVLVPGRLSPRLCESGCRELLPFSLESISVLGHWCGRDKARLTVGVAIHPKGVGWDWGQGSVRASSSTPNWGKTVSFTNLARGRCHVETRKGGLPQNCCRKIGSTLFLKSSSITLYR